MKLWSVSDNHFEELRSLQGHQSRILHLGFSPDGKQLASSCEDASLKLWNLIRFVEFQTLSTSNSNGVVRCFSFSHDSKLLAAGNDSWTIKLWSMEVFQEVKKLQGHQAKILAIEFTRDDKTLVSGSEDGSLKLWSVDSF